MTGLLGRTAEVATSVEVATGKRSELAVLIEGAPGIGKTVVLDAAIAGASAADALVLQTRPSEAEARMPLLGLHDLLAPVSRDVLGSLAAGPRGRLEAALGVGSAVPSGTAESDAVDEGQLAIAVLQALRGLAARRRVVVAIDDLQWLDSSTAAVLDVALARLRNEEVRLLATARPGAADAGMLSLERRFRDRLVRFELAGFALGDLHRLVQERLGRTLPRPTLIRIHDITRGNPFHALELARALGEGTIAGDGASTSDALSTAVPADVEALLRHRIERLSPAARDVVGIVALSPRPSNATVARALEIPIADVESHASAGVDAGLLLVTDRGIALAHPLVGGAARRVLGAAGTRALHLRLAAVVDDADLAAVHLSLGTTLPDASVAAALEAAARRGLARGATIDAIDQLDRTIQLTPPDRQDDLVRRRLLLVRALLLAGDTRRAGLELDAPGVEAIADPTMRAEAVLLLGVVQRYLGQHTAALARHEDALRWVTDDAIRARLHVRLAWLNEHDIRASLEHATEALALLQADTAPLDYSFALLLAARLRLHLGLEADHEAVARGADLQADAGQSDWNVSTTPIDWAVWMDDWSRARSLLEAGTRAAELAGDETLSGALLRRRIEVETWSGELATAARLVDTAVEQAESTQQVPAIASAKARRALVRAHLGDLEGAAAEAEEAYALADGLDIPPVIGYAATAVAAAASGLESFDRVDVVASRATAALDASGDVDQTAHRFHSDHLDALVQLGALDRARELVERLGRRGGLGPRPTWSGVAARGAGAIALAEGRPDDAAQLLERALVFHGTGTVPLEQGRTLLAAARLERRLGRRKAAGARLAEALGIFDRIGAAAWAGHARTELSQLSGARVGPDVLTPSEARIATLASEGLRNREIAVQLGISEKTVEAALGHAYEKLQIRSRAQLATALRLRGS